ncbi:tyrosine-type recombinase/integrase [Pseudoclavibacter helvolus]|uniref:tyrosine-type recombinase/integrase n=2 Tax=Pseudoclavibacter helvolus TaxID=255205 RepID=UPI000A9AF1CA|nr:site-specific integrase [Pseudoclavibacter helvolus]
MSIPSPLVPETPSATASERRRTPRQTSRWDAEYGKDVWRLRELGIKDRRLARITFEDIGQSWLKALAKRWARWRLATGLGVISVSSGTRAITHFGQFLEDLVPSVQGMADLNREVLECYLAHLHARFSGTVKHRMLIGQLNLFFTTIRQHGWDDSLPSAVMFYSEDFPKEAIRQPRALSETVMAQLENADNLAKWNNSSYTLITQILMGCGLRITDTVRLPTDCIVYDGEGAPYLRYLNHKMKREALVPIDADLADAITAQRRVLQEAWPDGAPVLFPRVTNNDNGQESVSDGVYRKGLHRWLKRCAVRDEHGQPVRVVPHSFRHTLGTRLINRDVPQEVVRRIPDHDSHVMTAHYARLSDTTIRRHWEAARKVNIKGETVTLDPDGPLAEAAWAKQRVGRATQALPNGFRGLPVQKSCPHANACLSCPMFITTSEFLPEHRQHRQQVVQIITAAEARGQQRLVEMNQQVLGNLDQIITTLENDEDGETVPSAR